MSDYKHVILPPSGTWVKIAEAGAVSLGIVTSVPVMVAYGVTAPGEDFGFLLPAEGFTDVADKAVWARTDDRNSRAKVAVNAENPA